MTNQEILRVEVLVRYQGEDRKTWNMYDTFHAHAKDEAMEVGRSLWNNPKVQAVKVQSQVYKDYKYVTQTHMFRDKVSQQKLDYAAQVRDYGQVDVRRRSLSGRIQAYQIGQKPVTPVEAPVVQVTIPVKHEERNFLMVLYFMIINMVARCVGWFMVEDTAIRPVNYREKASVQTVVAARAMAQQQIRPVHRR